MEEAMLSEFDYFEPITIQSSIQDDYDVVIEAGTSIKQGNAIEFLIPGASGIYVDVNSTRLEVKCRIVDASGNAITTDVKVGPTNFLMHTMFQSVIVQLCGGDIGESHTLYPYVACIEHVLTYDKRVTNTRALAEGWNKDIKLEASDTAGANTGLVKRTAQYAKSGIVTLSGRLYHDLFHIMHDIPPKCSIKVKVKPSSDAFCLMAANDNVKYKLEIVSAVLRTRMKRVSESLILAHEAMLAKTNYRIPYTKVYPKTLSLASGSKSYTFQNLYQGTLPDRVVVALVADANMAGAYNLNPLNFEHFGVSELSLSVNGTSLPREAMKQDFVTKDYIRSYYSTLEALGCDTGDRCIDLTPAEWAEGYTLFAFKITPGPIGLGTRSIPKTGTIGFKINFANALTAGINVILLSEEPAFFEIDKDYKLV